MNVSQQLTEAARNGEVVTIVYQGGGQPGAKRRIYPIRCTDREIRARDLATDEVKNYLIAKIEIVSDDHDAPWYDPGQPAHSAAALVVSLAEAMRPYVTELESLGWLARISESDVGIYKFFKNGRPRKTPDAGIIRIGDAGSPRPLYVFGPGLASARTFSHLDKAVALFLEQARSYAPGMQFMAD